MNNNNGNSSKVKSLLLYLGIPIVIILIMTLVLSQGQKDTHTYSEIVGYFHDDKVETFDVERNSSSLSAEYFRTCINVILEARKQASATPHE